MVVPSRYNVTSQEAGMIGDILQNKHDITDQKTLDDTETLLLTDTHQHFIALAQQGKIRYDLSLLFKIHRYFLGSLYSWAGKLRTVDISKDGTLFASSRYLKSTLHDFETIFKKNIPHLKETKIQIATKLTVIHVELNAIHPFREGNGRTIRLLLDLLAIHAGFHSIDWSKRTFQTYIRACRAGMRGHVVPMKNIIFAGLNKTR